MKQDTFIVIKIELPFKCNLEDFEEIYQKFYKGEISHQFIRTGLELSDSVMLKFNGTFKRSLYLLDENNCLYMVQLTIKTALWFNDKTDKWYIDDPEELLQCEDRMVGATRRLEYSCVKFKVEALLNSKYTEVFNKSLPAIDPVLIDIMRFPFSGDITYA